MVFFAIVALMARLQAYGGAQSSVAEYNQLVKDVRYAVDCLPADGECPDCNGYPCWQTGVHD